MRLKKFITRSRLFFVLLIFLIHQIFYISKVGVHWDSSYSVLSSQLTIGKVQYLLSGDRSSYYVSDFSDPELFGMFYYLQSYLFASNLVKYFNFNNPVESLFYFKHLYLNIYTVVVLSIMYFMIKKIKNENYSFLFVTFIVSIPLISGHSLFNEKDIPFALHIFLVFLFYFYFVDQFSKNKKISINYLIFTGFAIGSAMLIRLNAIVFIFFIIFSILIYKKDIFKEFSFITTNLRIAIIAIILFLLGTVQGWSDYLNYLKFMYWRQFKINDWLGSTLINGTDFYSDETTLLYLFNLLIYKLPIAYLVILTMGLILAVKKINEFSIESSVIVFLMLFFTSFAIYKPVTYSYLRHYLFLLFFINLLFVNFLQKITQKYSFKNALIFIVFSSIIWSQTGLAEYKYSYLNELVDEDLVTTSGEECVENNNCGLWSTDYWSTSGKALMNNINDGSVDILFSCAPFHTLSIFNDENTQIQINDRYSFVGSSDIMNYLQPSDNQSKSSKFIKIYTDKNLFKDVIENNSYDSYHIAINNNITSEGSGCLRDLNIHESSKCEVQNKTTRLLRGNEIIMNYLLFCELNL